MACSNLIRPSLSRSYEKICILLDMIEKDIQNKKKEKLKMDKVISKRSQPQSSKHIAFLFHLITVCVDPDKVNLASGES